MDIAEAVRKAGVSVGYDQLKDEQVNILCTFVEGRDVFVSLPTGFGKSLCYMLLPLVLDYLAVESGGGCYFSSHRPDGRPGGVFIQCQRYQSCLY